VTNNDSKSGGFFWECFFKESGYPKDLRLSTSYSFFFSCFDFPEVELAGMEEEEEKGSVTVRELSRCL